MVHNVIVSLQLKPDTYSLGSRSIGICTICTVHNIDCCSLNVPLIRVYSECRIASLVRYINIALYNTYKINVVYDACII